MHAEIPVPGLVWGAYPERTVAPRHWTERCGVWMRHVGSHTADTAAAWWRGQDAAWIAQVRDAQDASRRLAPSEALAQVRVKLMKEGLSRSAQVQAFGLVALTAQRLLNVEPFDTQLLAARAVLDSRLAEMATGEGKTLAVALAASVAALVGMPVHVVTANEYLVARDALRLEPLYAALGISVGFVVQAHDPAARARAYACDITYVTAKELVFDYLRDGLSGSACRPGDPTRRRKDALAAPLARLRPDSVAPALLRGLCMAIIDEADAILIDEARVPLILSHGGDGIQAADHADCSLRYARTLRPEADFHLNRMTMAAELTDHGRTRLDRAAASLAEASASPAWRNRLHREHAICTALAALHLYERERHYLVRDEQIVIIDETTGRVAEGRAWSGGLQQLIEVKEGCKVTPPMSTIAQITYQRFFPRYLRLGGMSGTLCEARAELMATYGLAVRRVPLRRPSQRRVGPTRLYARHETLWSAVAERIKELHRSERPVLVATDSVGDAQALSERLGLLGLPHAVLHARNDQEEAMVVARAGRRGAITVTTNMSGRGTDIELEDGVAAIGGLHVICCQLNSARRIDRQLAGRAARQGDPGSVETLLSLETALLDRSWPQALRSLLGRAPDRLPSWAVRALARWPQAAEERMERLQRRRLIEHDERTERQLGFGGPAE